jgi:hypothetical protein
LAPLIRFISVDDQIGGQTAAQPSYAVEKFVNRVGTFCVSQAGLPASRCFAFLSVISHRELLSPSEPLNTVCHVMAP